MRNGDDLPAHVVVEPVDAVGVDEAVAHPEAGLHGLVHLSEHVERLFDSILSDLIQKKNLICLSKCGKRI